MRTEREILEQRKRSSRRC